MRLSRFLRERNAAFEAGDTAWAKRMLPPLTSERVTHAAFHKARAACTDVSPAKRAESLQWLKDNRFGEYGQFWQGTMQ